MNSATWISASFLLLWRYHLLVLCWSSSIFQLLARKLRKERVSRDISAYFVPHKTSFFFQEKMKSGIQGWFKSLLLKATKTSTQVLSIGALFTNLHSKMREIELNIVKDEGQLENNVYSSSGFEVWCLFEEINLETLIWLFWEHQDMKIQKRRVIHLRYKYLRIRVFHLFPMTTVNFWSKFPVSHPVKIIFLKVSIKCLQKFTQSISDKRRRIREIISNFFIFSAHTSLRDFKYRFRNSDPNKIG
jgi:hypothetical protein